MLDFLDIMQARFLHAFYLANGVKNINIADLLIFREKQAPVFKTSPTKKGAFGYKNEGTAITEEEYNANNNL